MTNYPKELVRFNKDRNMHNQSFDLKVASINILEELFEAHGLKDDEDRSYSSALYKELTVLLSAAKKFDKDLIVKVNEDDIVDAFCDIQTFAFGEPLKMGYDPIKSMDETAKEINSREGKIINGKFTKFKTPEAKAKWYKANYSSCRIK